MEMEASVRKTKLRAKSTPEKRTEKELRHLGISLKDVPTGGRAKRSSAKYFSTSLLYDKETKDHNEPSTPSTSSSRAEGGAEDAHKANSTPNTGPPEKIPINLEQLAETKKTLSAVVKKEPGTGIEAKSNGKGMELQKARHPSNLSPVRRAKFPVKRKSPRLSNTPLKRNQPSGTKPYEHETTPTKKKIDLAPRRSPRTPRIRLISDVESPKEKTPVKNIISEKSVSQSQPPGPQKPPLSSQPSVTNKTRLKKASKSLLSSLSTEQTASKKDGTLLKKMLSKKGRLRVAQGKVSKHTGMMIKLKRLQNLRKFPKKSQLSKLAASSRKDRKKSPEPERKDHKKTPSPRKQLKKEREKVKLALERQEPCYDQLRRKKLRSEISDQSELWEGFPVDIRMPRLKPRSPGIGNSQSSQASADEEDILTPEKATLISESELKIEEVFRLSSSEFSLSPKKSDSGSQRQLFAASPSTSSAFENILKTTISSVLASSSSSQDDTNALNTLSYFGNPIVPNDKQGLNVKAEEDSIDILKVKEEVTSAKRSLHYDSETDIEDQYELHQLEGSQKALSVNPNESLFDSSIAAMEDGKEEVESNDVAEVTLNKSQQQQDSASDTVSSDVLDTDNGTRDSTKSTEEAVEYSHKTPEKLNSEKRQSDRESLRLKIKVLRKSETSRHAVSVDRKRKRDVRLTRAKAKTPLKYGINHDRLFTSLPERSSGRNNRVSLADQELLSDNRMAKHACSLWVSEQRRGFQQQHSGLSSTELDTLMREAWETHTKKEKLRYFNRARIALQDRAQEKTQANQRSRKSRASHGAEKSEPKTIEAFLKLPPDAQDRLLKRKMLELEQKLSAASYQQLLQTFYTNYARSKFCVEQLMRQRGEPEDNRVDKLARRLLYIAIMDNDDKLTSADQLKAAALTLQINTRFNKLVRELMESDNPGETCDNISERLSEVFEAITAIQSSECIPVELPSRHINSIIHELKSGTVDALMEMQVTPTETWQVPTMCDNEETEKLLEIPDNAWKQLSTADIDDYFEFIQPATKKFIAVPLNKEGGCEAFTIELSETDAEPLLSNMLLNKAELALNTKEQCCQLDSPSCQMSTLLLADAATQLETNLTHKKRSAARQRSHVIHAQNSQPFSSQCHGNAPTPTPAPAPAPAPQCSSVPPKRSHDSSQQQLQQQQKFSPSSYYGPYRPPLTPQHQGPPPPPPPPQPPQKYVTYQMYPQQQQQQQQQSCHPPLPSVRPMPFQPRGGMRAPSMPWRPPITSQARQDHRMGGGAGVGAISSSFRPQSAPRMVSHMPATNPPKNTNNIMAQQGVGKPNTPRVDSGKMNQQSHQQQQHQPQDSARIVIQGILREASSSGQDNQHSNKGVNATNPGQESLTSQKEGTIKSSASATRVISHIKSCDRPLTSRSPSPGSMKQGEIHCSTTRIISQGTTKIIGPVQTVSRTSGKKSQQHFKPIKYANSKPFPVRMSNANLIRSAPPSTASLSHAPPPPPLPRVLYQTLKSDESSHQPQQQNGQSALDLSAPARSQSPATSCSSSRQQSTTSPPGTHAARPSTSATATTLIVSKSGELVDTGAAKSPASKPKDL